MFDLSNNIYNQCLQEIINLTFTHEVANELFAKEYLTTLANVLACK